MSVQKKSLISNRNVTKKALIAKGAESDKADALKVNAQAVHTLKVKAPTALTSFKSAAKRAPLLKVPIS